MEEKTADEIAQIYSGALASVAVINADADYSAFTARMGAWEDETEWKAMIKRNVDHLELIKAYKKVDGTTSIWTNENFTAIDAAVTSGKSKIAAL